MNQETKNKFAELLAAQQAKANPTQPIAPKQESVKESVKEETKQPEPPTQELSSLTIGDLLNEPQIIAPIFKLIDYSDKGFAIIIPNYEQLSKEDTRLLIEKLHNTGGKYNKWLRCGKGWIFSKKKAYTVRRALNLI